MKRDYYKKLIALFLCLALVITIVPEIVQTCVKAAPTEVVVNYQFANNEAGMADGSINVNADKPGLYYFYWGDSNGNKLKKNNVLYSELGWCEASTNTKTDSIEGTYKVISPYTAIPAGAKSLVTYYKETASSTETKVDSIQIPANKQFSDGASKYEYALLSDIHYNRYTDYSADDSVPAFNQAMKFLNSQKITFVGLTGDLSRSGENSAYTKYKAAIDKYPGITTYTCTGNHDDRNIDGFKKYVNLKSKTDKNVVSKSSNGLDFAYLKGGDVFIFFSQTTWEYNTSTSRLVTNDQLNWLEKTLNTYANKNVYLFFHTYFATPNGDVTKAVGNLKNPGGYTYDLTYTYGNADEKRFRTLLNKYNNVTMFSGHSHWAYSQQIYNSNLNIGNISNNKTGATLLHVSSVGDPRVIGNNDSTRTELNGQASEGTVATKYSTGTVFTGTDLKNEKYLAYATYYAKDGKKTTPIPKVTVGKTKITSVGKVKKVSKKSKKYKSKIKFKKVTSTVGYEIKYSTKKSFSKKTTKVKKTKKSYYTITKLKNKTKYYIKVRAYKVQFGYNIYGKYSKTKVLKIKKK